MRDNRPTASFGAAFVSAPCMRRFDRATVVANGRPPQMPAKAAKTTIFVIDHDPDVREAIGDLFERNGFVGEFFGNCPDFLTSLRADRRGCVLIDALMLGMNGFDLIERLKDDAYHLPTIVMSARPTLAMAVQAMRAGAVDFVSRPFDHDELLASIRRAETLESSATQLSRFRKLASARVATLTARQRQIMDLVVAGHPSKNIASDLNISPRTVENHRASIARKTGARSLPSMVHTALCASCALNNGNSDASQK